MTNYRIAIETTPSFDKFSHIFSKNGVISCKFTGPAKSCRVHYRGSPDVITQSDGALR